MKILIAIPCMDEIDVPFVESLLRIRRNDIVIKFQTSSLVYDSRNKLSQYAVDNEFDKVLWLDSDMVFTGDQIDKLIEASESRDFASGLYFNRRPPYKPAIFNKLEFIEKIDGDQVEYIPIAENYIDHPESGIHEIEGAGFGAVVTSVSMLKDIWTQRGMPFSPVLGFGEDLSFCLRARELGYKLYCDFDNDFIHLGKMGVQKQYAQAFLKGYKNESSSN